MPEPTKLKTCQKCRSNLPLEQFYSNGPGKPDRKRISDYCFPCRAAIILSKSIRVLWGWEHAVCKHRAMSVARTHDGTWSNAIDPVVVRTLRMLQRDRCGVTHVPLTFPPTRLPSNSTLDQWASDYVKDPKLRECIPVIVRATRSTAWEPGNVVLVAAMVEPMIKFSGSVAAVSNMFKHMPTPVIPPQDRITSLRGNVEESFRKEFIAERQEKINEEKIEADICSDVPKVR